MNQPVYDRHPEVYHYTDANGLKGIIENQCLLATHYTHLNDTTEIRHAKPYLKAQLAREMKRAFGALRGQDERYRLAIQKHGGLDKAAEIELDTQIDEIFKLMLSPDNRGRAYFDPHVLSFCAHTDKDKYTKKNGLLSMWRGYSGGAASGGFAIVFDSRKLKDAIVTEFNHYAYNALFIDDVAYESHTQYVDEKFLDAADNTMRLIKGAIINDYSALDNPLKFFIPFVKLLACYKHRAFEEEAEIRIVAAPVTPERFDELDGIDQKQKETVEIAGKQRVRLFDDPDMTLPIRRVIVGPHRNGDRNLEIARELVKEIADVEVHPSETPYLGD